jgi:hypothetical protein
MRTSLTRTTGPGRSARRPTPAVSPSPGQPGAGNCDSDGTPRAVLNPSMPRRPARCAAGPPENRLRSARRRGQVSYARTKTARNLSGPRRSHVLRGHEWAVGVRLTAGPCRDVVTSAPDHRKPTHSQTTCPGRRPPRPPPAPHHTHSDREPDTGLRACPNQEPSPSRRVHRHGPDAHTCGHRPFTIHGEAGRHGPGFRAFRRRPGDTFGGETVFR